MPLNTRNRRGRLQSLFQHEMDYSGHSTRSQLQQAPSQGRKQVPELTGAFPISKMPCQHLRWTPLLRVAAHHLDCVHLRRLRHRPVSTTSIEIEIFAAIPQRWADTMCAFTHKIGRLGILQNTSHSMMS